MKERAIERTRGANPTKYVEVPANGSAHVFKLPRATECMRLVAWSAQHSVAVRAISEDPDSADPHAILMSMQPAEGSWGYLLGRCWWHPTIDLSVRLEDYPDTDQGRLEYGSEVQEELDDEGYSSADINACVRALTLAMSRRALPDKKETDARVHDFRKAREAG